MSISIPSHASVVVIGGGIMGCSTLYHLAKLGVGDAILLERNKLTSGTTWHSAAQVRALRSTRNMTNLIRYSISLYEQLEEETGQSVGWINKGSLSLACNLDRLTHIRRQEALAHLFGVRANAISVDEAKERWPLMNADDVIGAVWSPDDGRVSPSDLCAALVKGATGVAIYEDTAVIGIQTENGRVVGVRTEGGVIRCDAVALCAGLWSREVAQQVGSAVPLFPCEHFYLLTKPIAGLGGNLPTLSDHDSHLYCRDDSGGLLIGCFEPHGKAITPTQLGDNFAFQLLPEDWQHFEPMMENALARIPLLETTEIKMLLNGPESFTPDGVFMLGETAETKGLFLGCGMNSVGIATAGGAGSSLAHHIVHGYSPAALPEADPKRFPADYNSAATLAMRVPEVLGRHYEITYPHRQPTTARNLRLPPLTTLWRQKQAYFGQFYGWERPLYFNKKAIPQPTFNRPDWFEQVGDEVQHAHNQAAIFDLSTLGKIEISGADALAFMNRVCTQTMAIAAGQLRYTLLLNARGGIESDLIALRLDDETYRLYTATASIRRDTAWLNRQRQADERVSIRDITTDWAVIALCGEKAAAIASAINADAWNFIPYFTHVESTIGGCAVRVARLSYVGETGWEISCLADDAMPICNILINAGATPAGVLAQSAMRIEKQFLSYGHDMDTDMTPSEAGLDFAINWQKPFIGREALLAQDDTGRRMVSIMLDNGYPMGGEPVFVGDTIIGQTTSAAYGYRIKRPVALAFVNTALLASANNHVTVNIAGIHIAGQAVFGATFDPAATRIRAAIKVRH